MTRHPKKTKGPASLPGLFLVFAPLREGRIGGAGLDAHAEEPPDPKQYEGMDNVVLTPHMGAYTREALVNMAMGSVENLCAFFEGREPPDLVVGEWIED